MTRKVLAGCLVTPFILTALCLISFILFNRQFYTYYHFYFSDHIKDDCAQNKW
jgi:hypothetical protein